MHANDTGAEIAQTRSLLNEIKFKVELKLMEGHKPISLSFCEMPLQWLIKLCHREVEVLKEKIENKQSKTNMKIVGHCTLKVSNTIANGVTKEIMQKVDATNVEKECGCKKIGCNSEYVDIKGSNVFPANLITLSIIKCTNGHN